MAKYKEMYGGAEPPEDAADAYAAGQVLQAAVEAVGSIDDQEAMADWLRENAVDDHPRPTLSGTTTASRTASS